MTESTHPYLLPSCPLDPELITLDQTASLLATSLRSVRQLAREDGALSQTDVVTAEDLETYGMSPADIRRWPVPEYTDSDGRPYWLLVDLAPWLNGSDTRGSV